MVATAQINTDLPSKNRVGGFGVFTHSDTWTNRPPVADLHQEIETRDTTNASGLAFWLSRDPIAENGGINLYQYVGNNPVNFIDPLGLRLRITGSSAEKQRILDTLSQFVRGNLSLDDKGYVSREGCSQDEDYDRMIDGLIQSDNYYEMFFGNRHDGSLLIGGAFSPDGWTAGTIYLEDYQPKYRTKIFGSADEPGTLGTTLAHELVHAAQHLERREGANTQRGTPKLESDAIKRANPVYPRMGKPTRIP